MKPIMFHPDATAELRAAGAGRTLGISNEQLGRAITAVSQAIGNQTLQAEELKGQLEEALPGATRILQQALGVTRQDFNTLLREGRLTTDVWLPALIRGLSTEYPNALRDAAASTDAQLNRMKNSWQEFLGALGQGGLARARARSVGAGARASWGSCPPARRVPAQSSTGA